MNFEVLQLGFQIRIVVLVVIFQSMTPNMDTLCLFGMGCFRVLSGLLVFAESSEECIRVPPAQQATYSAVNLQYSQSCLNMSALLRIHS